MTIIYDETGVPGAHDALMQALRREGVRFRLRTARYYGGPEEGADAVWTNDPDIAADYRKAGAHVHALDEIPSETKLHSVGGGWWDVVVEGQVMDRVQGEDAAAARLDELTTSNNNNTD